MRWYGAEVQYEYSVGGIPYISNRLSFEVLGTRSPKSALKEMNRYRHQHQVVVYYDPTNPQQSVLEPANIGDISIPLMVGILLVFLGIFFLYDEIFAVRNRGAEKHLEWGIGYQKQGRFNEALIEFNNFIELSPNLVEGYKNRGDLYLQLNDWDHALSDLNQAVRIDPTDAFIYFSRGKAYLGKRQHYKAWTDMQKAMEMGFKVNPVILEEIKRGL